MYINCSLVELFQEYLKYRPGVFACGIDVEFSVSHNTTILPISSRLCAKEIIEESGLLSRQTGTYTNAPQERTERTVSHPESSQQASGAEP